MMRVARFFPTVMVAALVAGCGGGQTGDLSGKNDQDGGDLAAGHGCDEQLSEIPLDDASALGFDARRVLALAAQGYQADLAWQALDHVEYSPSASQSTVALTFQSLNKAWLVHHVPNQSSGEQGGTLVGVICPRDRLRVAVHVDLQSADGALAESFDGALESATPVVATLKHAIDMENVTGSFAITHVTPLDAVGAGTASVDNVSFDAVFTPGGMAGALTAQLTSQNSQVASGSSLTFARFPGDLRCSGAPGSIGFGVPVSADNAALGQTGAEALSQVNAAGALPLEWEDRTHSTITLELSELGDGCVQVGNGTGYDEQSQSPATAVYPVTLKAKTADGRLQGQYPAKLVTLPSLHGSGFTQRIEMNATFPADAPSATGFSQVSIPSGTHRLSVAINGEFDPTFASGKIAFAGLTDPPCVTNPEPPSGNSVPGCSGTSVALLLSAFWQ